jgi:hypothetical protein
VSAAASTRCKVCRLPSGVQAYVNARLFEGDPPRGIARRIVGVSRVDVAKHDQRCPNTKAPKEKKETDGKEERRE